MALFDEQQVWRELEKNSFVLVDAIEDLYNETMVLREMFPPEGPTAAQLKERLALYESVNVSIVKPALSLDDSLAIIRAAA